MTAVVAVETVLLVLLVVLVGGLLRSHAEILRRLGPPEGDGEGHGFRVATVPSGVPAPPEPHPARAAAVAGATPAGDLVKLAFDGDGAPTLLAFLSTGCGTCGAFWSGLGQQSLPAGVGTVVITRGEERESPARLRSLATPGVPVVMSSQAWEDYRVPGAPYFVLVDGGVRGEGVATTWPALTGLVTDAIEDSRAADAPRASATERGERVDTRLAAAGILPGHPSLYPGNGAPEH
jgi:hypothetical protein